MHVMDERARVEPAGTGARTRRGRGGPRGHVAVLAAAALVAAMALAAPAAACPADAAERAAALRDRLERERTKAFRWRLGWALGFGAATAGQLALYATETAPLGEYDDAAEASLLAGAAKSFVGMSARIVLPLKVPRPSTSGDGCADLAAAEAALARAARSEQRSFWLNHLGGLALQLAGTLYIGLSVEDAWGDAAISFGLGYAVGLASTYTQPRGAWHLHRRGGLGGAAGGASWQVVPLASPRAHGLAIVGEF